MKKFLTLLALIMATVTAYATDYTDNASSTYSSNMSGTHSSKTVTVEETGSGEYTFVVKGVYAATLKVGDFTMTGVKGVTNSDGSISYSFSGDATTTNVNTNMATENGTKAVTMSATSKE